MGNSTTPGRDDAGKLLLRVAVGAILLFHGVFKLRNGVEWIKGPLDGLNLPGFLAYGTYLAEVIAPVLLILGFRTKLAALVIAIDMLMAVVLVLRDSAFGIKPEGGGWAIELEALIFFAALALVIMGGGRYAIARGRWD